MYIQAFVVAYCIIILQNKQFIKYISQYQLSIDLEFISATITSIYIIFKGVQIKHTGIGLDFNHIKFWRGCHY